MTRLQKNRLSMVIEELFLPFREGSNVHDFVCLYPHSIQRWDMGYGGDDQYTGIFEADKPAIKKVVNRGSQQESVLAIKSFLIVRISPRFAMARSQMDRIRNASDSALSFDFHDPFFEKTLPTPRDDQGLTFCIWYSGICLDVCFDVMLPDFQIGVLDLHRSLGWRFFALGTQHQGLLAN